jgi:putative SOS response-associated peptidase YedK
MHRGLAVLGPADVQCRIAAPLDLRPLQIGDLDGPQAVTEANQDQRSVSLDWNKPPTAPMLVAIRSIDGERVPKMMKWGLIPHWAKDDNLQYSTFNARAEEFTTKPAFRDAWKRDQRCLVVTDGFYEWKKLDPKESSNSHMQSPLPTTRKW